MKKVILVDGNNLLFRSYYATAYSGNMMRNSKGFPTNGLYGFVNMINKIINEEKPIYMLVAFDIGKTFRHDKYDEYKGGRNETPDELKMQFPVAKELLTKMGIKYLEVVNYEADDIIGTFARMIDEDDDYEGLIVSSDKDLLQLISKDVTVKLLKSRDYILMNSKTFFEIYGIEPSGMIDLKGLMGDSSDNIPGVKGIGEKTAVKLLKEYKTIDNLYEHIDNVKGALYKKLIDGRDSAFFSRELATICCDVPVGIGFDDIKLGIHDEEGLMNLYKELGFNSFIKKMVVSNNDNNTCSIITDTSSLVIDSPVSIYLDMDGDNYHKSQILGISIYSDKYNIYIPYEFMGDMSYIKSNIYTYDWKKLYVVSRKNNFKILNCKMDVMIAGYLLNYNVRDDIAYIANEFGYSIEFNSKKIDMSIEELSKRGSSRAKFIYEVKNSLEEKMKVEEVDHLFYDIELPLSTVLGKMEYEGICCDTKILEKMGEEIKARVEVISQEIYRLSGVEFNISSPLQLGEVLFEKMGLPHGKKNKKGYSTDEATLSKLKDYEIVKYILEYRMLTKLYSTYVEGLIKNIMEDGRIHTIYTQTLTRTGRLSSIEPNLQNIPVRNEYGRLIRKCFVADSNSKLLSSDYSQIELRLFAHLAGVTELIKAFQDGIDIHSKTASDIYGVDVNDVSANMRRNAKAVNFGIIYGISSYGLASDLNISNKDAKLFIDKYFEAYPGIKNYMDKVREDAYKLGYVKTIMNRKRVIEELNNPNYNIRSIGERMALNTPIQGSSADILKLVMIKIDEKFTELNLESKMLLQIHDELVFNVKNDEVDIVSRVVKEIMENTYKLSVPLVVDMNFGNNLYEAK